MPVHTRRIVALLGAAALFAPGVALADSDKREDSSPVRAHDDSSSGERHGKAKKGGKARKLKLATYVVRGTYAADGTVEVTGGNAHARRGGLIGDAVAFDFSDARVVVADTDGDGESTVADLVAGDRVLVQARLPRRSPGTGPYAARKVVDRTNPPADEDASEPEIETEAGA